MALALQLLLCLAAVAPEGALPVGPEGALPVGSTGGMTPSAVIFPPQTIPLRFSHKAHLGKAKLACEVCHDRAATSKEAKDVLIPKEEACLDCHPVDRKQPFKQAGLVARCDGCHPGWSGDLATFQQSVIPQPNLKFSHQAHVSKGIGCVTCHENVPTRDMATRNDLPRMRQCLKCHTGTAGVPAGSPDVTAGIAPMLGQLKKPPATGPTPAGASADAPAPGLVPIAPAPSPYIPARADALKAKPGASDAKPGTPIEKAQTATAPVQRSSGAPSSKCSTCHLSTPSGMVETQYSHDGKDVRLVPSGALRGDAHTPTFRTDHAAVARNDEAYCLSCHRKDECLTCHNGVRKPMDFHGNDYISLHPVDARRDALKCQSCHRLQTFCIGCHQRVGVAYDPPGGDPRVPTDADNRNPYQSRGAQFHPAGWTSPLFATNPAHHAWQAQRNIKSCVSCHREESCLQCHSNFNDPSRKMSGINPHPPGWRGSTRCQSLADRNPRMCLKCHELGSPLLDCAR